MAIYPDKKNGKLTGRFRVELQRGKERYRKRWDTLDLAKADEAAVMASWGAGDTLPAPGQAPGAPQSHTLDSVIPLARGHLWDGLDTENLCFQRMEIMANLMGRRTRLDDIDTHRVDQLITKLREQKRSDGTINRYLCHLHVFLQWARKRKYRTLAVDGDEGIEFSWRKESKGRIRWITTEEQRQLKDFLTNRPHEKAGAAKYVWDVIQIAIETGCRRDEILTAKLDQINGHYLTLWETKTESSRTIPLSPETQSLLVGLIRSKKMPTHRSLRTWWDRAKAHMNLDHDADFVFHACRHTCATRMIDADVNIFVIQEWMGHKVIETTKRYAHVKPQNLDDALRKVGNHHLLVSQNPSISALYRAPHTLPTVGGEGYFTAAA